MTLLSSVRAYGPVSLLFLLPASIALVTEDGPDRGDTHELEQTHTTITLMHKQALHCAHRAYGHSRSALDN